MADVYLGLGANLGDKERNLRQAVACLRDRAEVCRLSSLYRTEPVGFREQDWFLNAAARLRTGMPPEPLLRWLLSIEESLGRIRGIPGGPRTVDLDILFYDDLVICEKGLAVPHPRLQDRAFVLVPLHEIAPDRVHPVLNKTVGELLAAVNDASDVELYSSRWDPAVDPESIC